MVNNAAKSASDRSAPIVLPKSVINPCYYPRVSLSGAQFLCGQLCKCFYGGMLRRS